MSAPVKSVTFASSARVTVTQQSSSDEDAPEAQSDEDAEQGGDGVSAGTSCGWSDAMSRLLNCQVRGKNFILAKAKKDRDVGKAEGTAVRNEFEVVKESGEKEVVTDGVSGKGEKEKKERKEDVGRKLRQKVAEADVTYELKMNAIATRGVVQLFNAVNQQRFRISKKLRDAGSSETRKDRVLASVSKGEFLDSLKLQNDEDDEAQRTSHPEPVAKRTKRNKRDGPEKIRFKDVFSDNFAQKDESQ